MKVLTCSAASATSSESNERAVKGLLNQMWLAHDTFQTIVTHTPLVSIDLIVRDLQGRVLLGKRRNRPARGVWFVPGGRVNKNETLDAAFGRITLTELGVELVRSAARFKGVFEHFYPDCFAGEVTSTHYVVLAFELRIEGLGAIPPDQHSESCWLTPSELLAADDVHENVKVYFR